MCLKALNKNKNSLRELGRRTSPNGFINEQSETKGNLWAPRGEKWVLSCSFSSAQCPPFR